ncbi:MAG: hypothetical protein PGN16_04250 [Sphingomonas phyllosphaerae]
MTERTAEAAALLLLLQRRRYDLPALIRASGTTLRPFRRIMPTEALRSQMGGPYFALLRAWAAERDAILAAYAAALPDRGAPLDADASYRIQRAVDDAAVRVERQLARFQRLFPAAVSTVDRWHVRQWVQRVQTATGVDVAAMTGGETEAVQSNAVTRNGQLLDQVHADTKGKMSAALMAALALRMTTAQAGSETSAVLTRAKKRVARIAVDQTDMLVEDLTRERAQSAGLTRWRWRHTPQKHPRVDHKARDQRLYTVRTQPNDLPGVLPFCKCWQEWDWS